MKNKKTKSALALALAAAVSCGVLAGCDSLISTDSRKDYQQIIAEVDISEHADFQTGGKYAAYHDVIIPAKILKREMVSSFVANYASLAGAYSYEMIFAAIAESLVNTQIYLQYSLVYLLENGAYDSEEATEKTTYSADKYLAAVAAERAAAKETGKYSDETVELMAATAGYAYFLSEQEIEKTEYTIKSMFNSALDTQEKQIIEADKKNRKEEEHDHSGDESRTLPSGVNTNDDEYVPDVYEIYIGTNAAANCGKYETVDDDTPTYRKRAYGSFLSNLESYGLVEKGEDSSDPEYLGYYQLERKTVYQNAIVNKIADCFEREAHDDLIKNDYKEIKDKFDETYLTQRSSFENDSAAFEAALSKVSDTNFLLYAPNPNNESGFGYGFVINILLPFSDKQSEALNDADGDFGDPNGNTFVKRASLLKNLTATDRRGAWFSGHNDYGFNTADSEIDGAYKGTLGNDADRTWLFFEDSIKGDGKYDRVKNYYGRYTYNGTVVEEEDDHFTATPKPITIDGFLDEMEGYLRSAGFTAGAVADGDLRANYYTKTYKDYYAKNTDSTPNYSKVDYSQFIYYKGKVDFAEGFDVNKVFDVNSKENLAMSIINELSFAYNTDTAGLNNYLGYAVSPYTTNFVKEFEYAAQEAVRMGAGAYTVAPSTYGWHIMYCTFAWNGQAADSSLYKFNPQQVTQEGTFSNLYFEAIKADTASTYANNARSRAITDYADCSTIYESRFKDLSNLGQS